MQYTREEIVLCFDGVEKPFGFIALLGSVPQSSKWFIKYAIHSSDLNHVELLRTVFKKRIVSDLVSDLGVSIWSLGTEPETNWIRLNITWNLSRVSHIRLNFQFIKVLLFKDLVGVQSEILWKRYFVFFVFPTYTQKHTPKYQIHKNEYQQIMVCIREVQKCH